ncbi:MAG: hypothetical protein N3J91_16615 [Verrucomicrobiae bacterium]|nr:hypothetical protein [Verrucomicrobiae bacterium]
MIIGSKTGDSRVGRLLDILGLKYHVDAQGDYQVSFRLENNRHQTVYIRSQTSHLGPLEIREIFSVGYESEGPLPGDVANALLVHNAHVKLGAWSLLRSSSSNRCYAAFTVQIAAETDPASLQTAMAAVVETADKAESLLTDGEDKF